MIAPCNRPIIFELTHTADLSQWSGDPADQRWKSYVKDIRRMVETGRAADAAAAEAAAPAPVKEPAPAGDDRVESLLSAVAALQEAIMKQGGQSPAASPGPGAAARSEACRQGRAGTRASADDRRKITRTSPTRPSSTPTAKVMR